MPERKKPTGQDYVDWCALWDDITHEGKLKLCEDFEITYGTAKHWRSDFNRMTGGLGTGVMPDELMSYPDDSEHLDTTMDGVCAVLNDLHQPFVDKRILPLVEGFLADIQPKYLVVPGDVGDFYALSEFDKNPARANKLQDDCDVVAGMFGRWRSILPKTQIWLLAGNHEDRLRRYLWSKGTALASLRTLKVEEMYGLNEAGVNYVPYEQGLAVNGTYLFLHGETVAKESGATARQMFDKHGMSGMSGHTHRMGSYYRRNSVGTFSWHENGCLCSLNPDWIKNPNWQQGFSLIDFEKSGRFMPEPIPIVKAGFIYGGKKYS